MSELVTPPTLGALPDDALESIVDKLDLHDTIRLAATSKEFRSFLAHRLDLAWENDALMEDAASMMRLVHDMFKRANETAFLKCRCRGHDYTRHAFETEEVGWLQSVVGRLAEKHSWSFEFIESEGEIGLWKWANLEIPVTLADGSRLALHTCLQCCSGMGGATIVPSVSVSTAGSRRITDTVIVHTRLQFAACDFLRQIDGPAYAPALLAEFREKSALNFKTWWRVRASVRDAMYRATRHIIREFQLREAPPQPPAAFDPFDFDDSNSDFD